MKEWPEKEGIVKAAISLISNMSYYSQDSQFAVGNAGGCEAIVAGMRKFPKNYIQMYACLAIRNLWRMREISNDSRKRMQNCYQLGNVDSWWKRESRQCESSSILEKER